jgi:hypothetical protein
VLKEPRMRAVVFILGFLLSFGCSHRSTSGDPGSTNPGGDPGSTAGPGNSAGGPFAPSSLQVTGQVVDFETHQALTTSMTMATAALVPPPNVSTQGASFTLDGVPPFSTFYMIAGSPPSHALTYNAPVTVTDQPLDNVTATTVSTAYLDKLKTAFASGPVAGTATVFVHVVDANGAAEAGIPAAALSLGMTGVKGPFFLDANMQPAANATATAASGYLVYFGVPAGTVKVASGAGYTATAADTPTAADDISIIEAKVVKGGTTTPPSTTVSFQNDVVPIFITRGCYNCHSGNGAGRRMGDLVLDGSVMKIYQALTIDISPNFHTTRVNIGAPEKSLVLTMPSYENPPDAHPTVVFTSSADPDYQKILAWIKAGAKLN